MKASFSTNSGPPAIVDLVCLIKRKLLELHKKMPIVFRKRDEVELFSKAVWSCFNGRPCFVFLAEGGSVFVWLNSLTPLGMGPEV